VLSQAVALVLAVPLGILSVAPLARVVRASTLTYANREFVLAAQALGARGSRIVLRELLPNVLPSALAFALVAVAVVIVAEGALSFLGLSVPPPTPTWGGMIAEGGTVLAQAPLVSLWPSVAMFLTLLALNIAGDELQAYFQVREGGL
jgi:peptide/nickel transport system permease protein